MLLIVRRVSTGEMLGVGVASPVPFVAAVPTPLTRLCAVVLGSRFIAEEARSV